MMMMMMMMMIDGQMENYRLR